MYEESMEKYPNTKKYIYNDINIYNRSNENVKKIKINNDFRNPNNDNIFMRNDSSLFNKDLTQENINMKESFENKENNISSSKIIKNADNTTIIATDIEQSINITNQTQLNLSEFDTHIDSAFMYS